MGPFSVGCLLAVQAAVAPAQSLGTFAATGSMTTPRFGHTATLLTNGKVLIAGGRRDSPRQGAPGEPLATAELYDPSTGTFSATGDMTTARAFHVATLLPDGRVLILGLSSAELYDPSTGASTVAGVVTHSPAGCCLVPGTPLKNGKVLIFALTGYGAQPVTTAIVYDPAGGTFTPAGEEPFADTIQTATLLANGQVLICGYSAQLYDPDVGTFTVPLRIGVNFLNLGYTATLLTDGRVMIAGGNSDLGNFASAAVYNPSTGLFTPTGDMTAARVFHTATLLPDGRVLMAGGIPNLGSSELYDPAAGTFTAAPDTTTPRTYHTATLLNDGRVLVTGGLRDYQPATETLATAELYAPPVLVPAPVLFSLSGDGKGPGAILHEATQKVVSSGNPVVAGEALEVYGAGLIGGGAIPPQVAIGGRAAEVLFFGNAPGFVGLNQVNVRVPGGVAPGATVPVRLSYLGRLSNEVTLAVE